MTTDWYVWLVEEGLPPKPIFVGGMEECQSVADMFNAARPTDGIGFAANPGGSGGHSAEEGSETPLAGSADD